MKKYLFTFKEKLRNKSDFNFLLRNGQKIISDNFIIYFCSNDFPYNRVAISIKRKVANSVKRNRMKRLLREFFRLNKNNVIFEDSYDFLLIARKDFSSLKLEKISEELLSLCQNFL